MAPTYPESVPETVPQNRTQITCDLLPECNCAGGVGARVAFSEPEVEVHPVRIHWHCYECNMSGVILVPIVSREFMRQEGIHLPRQRVPGALSEALSRRATFQPINSVAIAELAIEAGAERLMREIEVQWSRRVEDIVERYPVGSPDFDEVEDRLARMVEWRYERVLRRLLNEYDKMRRELAILARQTSIPIPTPPGQRLASGKEWRVMGPVIYGLVDPRKPEVVRYVGQTTNWAQRYLSHCQHTEYGRGEWILGLRSADLWPDMVLLEEVPHRSLRSERETWWIREWQSKGGADLNGRAAA